MAMTDKAIAYAWLNDLLKNPPTPDGLRNLAGVKLSDGRCEKVTARIAAETDRVAKRYRDFLNKAGHETT